MSILLEKLQSITGEFKETTPVLKTFIKEHGFLTGSSRWKIDGKESDIDILIKPHQYRFSDVILYHNGLYLHEDEENGIISYSQEDFQSCYVLIEGKPYNLLFMHTIEKYNKWVYATEKIDKKIKDIDFLEQLKDKEFRVNVFEELKNEYDLFIKNGRE